jgi:hypothetical protein
MWGKPLPTSCPHMFSTGKPMRPVYFFVENFGAGHRQNLADFFLLHTRWISFAQISACCPRRAGRPSTA